MRLSQRVLRKSEKSKERYYDKTRPSPLKLTPGSGPAGKKRQADKSRNLLFTGGQNEATRRTLKAQMSLSQWSKLERRRKLWMGLKRARSISWD